MSKAKKTKAAVEFGDFQTPIELARRVCWLIRSVGVAPRSIIEPTCGRGSFLVAALDEFPSVERVLAVEINPGHLAVAREAIRSRPDAGKVQLRSESFFDADWPSYLRELRDPLLIVGNPPWVTNSELGTLGSSNLPAKSNFQEHRGLDAITGKSNFDISEWMLIRMLEWMVARKAMIAMLCKTAVARKALTYAWKREFGLRQSAIYRIDAGSHFDAAVDACLLVCTSSRSEPSHDCAVYDTLDAREPAGAIGFRDGELIADIRSYERWRYLRGEVACQWRSGIKHDCAKVMELERVGPRYRNGLGDYVELEDDYLYPMLKSSEVAKGRVERPRRYMIVPQRSVGEDTRAIREQAPRTWDYLQLHAKRFERRASSIYRNRPRFSIFGVGDYAFAPWKVAVSGFYKRLDFVAVGSHAGKPIVLDDTVYFLPCHTREEAQLTASLLNSETARAFFSAFIFWDAKRPITVDVLRRLDLSAVAGELGSEQELARLTHSTSRKRREPGARKLRQRLLIDRI